MPFRLGFIKDGIRMISDGMSKDDIRIILENQEQYRAIREMPWQKWVNMRPPLV